jgi:hypothetical protein
MKIIRVTMLGIAAFTLTTWVFACWAVWRDLIKTAADSPEIYTRGPGFQLFNFLVQYLPLYLLVLVAVLGLEWLVYRLGVKLVRSRT